jgi:hypothetical protein
VLALCLLGVLPHCGGAAPSSPSEASPRLTGRVDRFTATPTLAVADVALQAGEPLAEAFARARQAYRRENLETFDPRRAYATSAAREFAWYFTLNDVTDPFGRTQHVFFVVTDPWTDETTRQFLLSYLVMPAAPVGASGRPWFTFYSADPPPWAVRYLFSNTALGAFEAAVLSELGASEWTAAQAPELAEAVERLLQRLELASSAALTPTCAPILDTLFEAVPHPPAEEPPGVFGRDYVPEGTLAAFGLLVGEAVRTELGGAAVWEPDEARVYPRLHVRDLAEGILRPIPMMIEFYLADAELAPSDYCQRVLANLRGAPAGGDD